MKDNIITYKTQAAILQLAIVYTHLYTDVDLKAVTNASQV